MSDTTQEINATAGQVGTSYGFTLTPRDSHLRVNGGPGRVATVTNVSGATLRHVKVDNFGPTGRFLTLAEGASRTITADDGSREFYLSSGDTAVLRIVISDG